MSAAARAPLPPSPPAALRAEAPADPADTAGWRDWVASLATLMGGTDHGLDLPPAVAAPASAPLCLLFSPHPDDECITGALPLRLRREVGWRVLNVALTLGSRPDRRAPRWRELQAACEMLGFENLRLCEDGFERLRPETVRGEPALWEAQLSQAAALLERERPLVLLAPHARDANATHQGVHLLARAAIERAGLDCVLAETEFWSTMDEPNCLVETGHVDTARLVQALACHAGEVARNPYHLRLPAWLADNVRRGGELLAGAGESAPDFAFGTLYRLSRWQAGRIVQDLTPRLCPADRPLDADRLFT